LDHLKHTTRKKFEYPSLEDDAIFSYCSLLFFRLSIVF
jgi:hypothetical protein